MKRQNGITLIALVISIIVMLILAGVSINAIVGDNGVLTRTQYASFLNEMAAVEEAVQLWKTGEAVEAKGAEITAIPTNGLCKVNELTSTERLVGEVGYYRIWSMSEIQPTTNILSDASTFNGNFESELIFYPAGVQDLYYLNNEAIGINENKTYLIDASTGMIYSMTGIGLKGIRCYSSNMAKAVMNGDSTMPLFAEAEVSGSGSGEALAGNVQSEYLEDGSLNPNYNPNGFQIIASSESNNIFKLYNNGDLYGKGIKGIQLNTSVEEMEKINQYVWNEFKVPSVIPGASSNNIQIYPGNSTVYVIDSEGYLWAWGSNGSNKLGLTEAQRIEFTEREPVKLNVDNKKVKKVYTGSGITFVITDTDEVYCAGDNRKGQLGLGYQSTQIDTFTKLELSEIIINFDVSKIKCIIPDSYSTFIWYDNGENEFYFAGTDRSGWLLSTGLSETKYYEKFTRIYDGNIGTDVDQDIKDILIGSSIMILKNDGTIWQTGFTGSSGTGGGGDLPSGSEYIFRQFTTDQNGVMFGSNVTGIYQVGSGRLITRLNDRGELEVWGTPGRGNSIGLGSETLNSDKYWKVTIPDELRNNGIKEIFSYSNCVYYLSNSGKVYYSGNNSMSGMNISTGKASGIVFTGLENIKTLYSTDLINYSIKNYSYSPICFTSIDGKIYTTGNSSIVYGDNILQKNWSLVASNVKYFDGRGSYYVDRAGDLWVAGDSRICGLGEKSEIYVEIPNYIKCTDTNIARKVEKAWLNGQVMYVLLNNKELWATGLFISDAGQETYPGWVEEENKTNFVKILDNVLLFSTKGTGYPIKLAITDNDEAYGWGNIYRASNGMGGNTHKLIDLPTKFELPETIGGVNNIKCINCLGWQRTALITNIGELFLTGTWENGSYDGGHTSTAYFSKYTYGLSLEENEKISDVAPMNDANLLMLTDKGRVFGYGRADYLGIGRTDATLMENQLLIGTNNINQIVAGSGFYVAITKDGKVYGTGSNTYGILGRWIGIDRKSPNSRYKTAFEWVECPELEI